MFLVFNKEKICSYLVSLGTVAILFVMAISISNRNFELIQTSTYAIIAYNIKEILYNRISKQNKVEGNIIQNVVK